MNNVLREVIAAVEEEGEALRAEFYRADGPRGRRGNAPVDTEIEERLKAKLQALVPCAFIGEETGACAQVGASHAEWLWLIDPHDGTFEFLSGRRGSAVSVALLRRNSPVLGVVCSPLSPDRGFDTIAWAEGTPDVLRNGVPVKRKLTGRGLSPGELLWATASSAQRPATYARAAEPARFVAMPSIAYRLARVAAGDGVAAISIHELNEYDIAAGMALVRAAGGVLLDLQGREIALCGEPAARIKGCFAGSREAAAHLASFAWNALEAEPRREPRVNLGFPRKGDELRLSRATGCLLGQVIGDSLGSRVELMSAAEIAAAYPEGVRELADGGRYHTLAGQPTDDSEMALTLARSLIKNKAFVKEEVLDAYRDWLQSRPLDVGATTERGLLGMHTTESESNGSLMRVSPIGVWAAGDPKRAADAARKDSLLTHSNPICLEACAGYAAAIAAGVGGGEPPAMLAAALANSSGLARDAIERGAAGMAPADYERRTGWVVTSLQNAFYRLGREDLEAALVSTVGCGGDTDTNAAIAGALLGAALGRDAIPSRWILAVLACRPMAEARALRPRPMGCWPDDVLDIAESLLNL
jgi:ADP-ribosylglycohydrolase/fructose-1,6-bisphosphatase/inositol monophosphatase family enzyme